MLEKIKKTEEEWKALLTPEQFHVMREKGTEPAGSCAWHNQGEGVYYCAACDLPLFAANTKFESGTGWPSYFNPINPEHIEERSDDSLGMHRVEVLCARCESHLGHVFEDGPPPASTHGDRSSTRGGPTGKRYCINSIALNFKSDKKMKNESGKNSAVAVFGGGCFWCIEAVFKMIKGVESVAPGYAGGEKEDPSYEEVSSGRTGHAEVIRIEYDPSVISYETLLEIFFSVHNPTTPNRQGNDVGTQYRSMILYGSDTEKEMAQEYIKKLEADKVFPDPVVTELVPLVKFYEAEEYHHDYFAKNPSAAYCQAIINPKVSKAREHFKEFIK